jgi:hypothetical protein
MPHSYPNLSSCAFGASSSIACSLARSRSALNLIRSSYRTQSGGWRGYLLSQQDDVVESSCLDLRLSLQQIYEGVELPPPGVGEPEPPEYEVVE